MKKSFYIAHGKPGRGALTDQHSWQLVGRSSRARVLGSKRCRVSAVWCDGTAPLYGLCGAGCVCWEQYCCDIPLPGEAGVEEMQLEACFPRQGSSTGNREVDSGGGLGH